MTEQTLKPRISDAMKDAMRAKDKDRLGTIRLIMAELKRVEVDERVEVTDQRVVTILDKMVKQRRDSIKQYETAGRQELADKEAAEIEVIQEFLPAALSEDAVSALIDKAIAETNAAGMRDMGTVMNRIRPELTGRADMGQVSKLVKQKLS